MSYINASRIGCLA